MRLKLLFFPLILAVCIIIILRCIVPQWEEMKTIKKEGDNLKVSLQDISVKKQNVDNLTNLLSTRKEEVSFIEKYLPKNKAEEKIIDNINYLASGVGLANVDLEDVKEEAIVADPNLAPAYSGMIGLEQPIDPLQVVAQSPTVKYTRATISIMGQYDSIMQFLSDLQKIPMFNSLESVKIEENKENAATSAGSTPSAEQTASGNLKAEIVIKFGSLAMANVNSGYTNPLFQKASFDFTSVERVKAGISGNIPSLEVPAAGKSNPFLP